METIDKHYIPEISEFHVDFECKHFSHLSGKWEEWAVDVFGLHELLNEELEDSLDLGHYRVKYLDRGDILECFPSEDITHTFQKPDLVICETTKETNKTYYKLVYAIKNRHLAIEDCEGLIFNGTIRNKSELHKILSQVIP